MGPGDVRRSVASLERHSTTLELPMLSTRTSGGWDSRLYTGLRLSCVPGEVRRMLADALGEVGVEAEFFLLLVNGFPGAGAPSHARGEAFLLRLEAAAYRLRHAGAALEVAAQSYLTALEAGFPSVSLQMDNSDVWWPPFAGNALVGEPLELRLRRCGFAYRHVVAAHLASTVDAIAEHLALILHALETLPPAGVLPASTLYQGLYELTSTLQGYIIPNHVTDVNPQAPGLLSGIARLRQLDTEEDTSLRSDLAWAHQQYAYTSSVAEDGQGGPGMDRAPSADARRWAAIAAREWQETILALEYLRASHASAPSRS
jgi:hypothetical protein